MGRRILSRPSGLDGCSVQLSRHVRGTHDRASRDHGSVGAGGGYCERGSTQCRGFGCGSG